MLSSVTQNRSAFVLTAQTGAFVVFTSLSQRQFASFFFLFLFSCFFCLQSQSHLICLQSFFPVRLRWRRQRHVCPPCLFLTRSEFRPRICMCAAVCARACVACVCGVRCSCSMLPMFGCVSFPPPNVLSLFVVHRSSAALFLRLLLPR